MTVKPKRHFGQHFLWDKNIARKIVNYFKNETPVSEVLEIGPGKGVLTDLLMEYFHQRLYAVEIDEESVSYLSKEYPDLDKHLIERDFLKMDLDKYFKEDVSIIGNFPYNISSQIFFKILEYRHKIPFVVGMLQKEVAERIAASPERKTYGILSVLLQAYYKVEILFHVGPKSFVPPPRINSSVVCLKRNNIKALDCDEGMFFRIVKQGFNQRRKILRNSLKSFLLNLESENVLLQKRPEQLSVDDFVELARLLSRDQ
ncbi:MAG: 16S rRNA (adenine(1518)-N(6)/adenine(1519)-N(6))-dimethyltransferase RsmA [Bacteroidales bacterium]